MMFTAKEIVLIDSIQRKMSKYEFSASSALESQQDDVNSYLSMMARANMELESVSGSPEQGLVLVFKDTST